MWWSQCDKTSSSKHTLVGKPFLSNNFVLLFSSLFVRLLRYLCLLVCLLGLGICSLEEEGSAFEIMIASVANVKVILRHTHRNIRLFP